MQHEQTLIFEVSREGRTGYNLPTPTVPEVDLETLLPATMIRKRRRNFRKYLNSMSFAITRLYLHETMGSIQDSIRSVRVR